MKYNIEKGVPLPVRAPWKEIAAHMEIGDSIVVGNQMEARLAATALKKAYGPKCSRQHKEETGVRVWRTK